MEEGDARELALPNESVDAYLSNVPFGRQYTMRGSIESWLTTVLAEAARVTRPGAPVVLVAPTIPRSVVPPAMRLVERHLIRLLGTRTAIWRYERR